MLPEILAQGPHTNPRAIKDTYDYVIVGGGTSGLTVADRLSESGKCECSLYTYTTCMQSVPGLLTR